MIELKKGETNCILPKDQTIIYNGQKVKWSIGDINSSRAKELGCMEICLEPSYREKIVKKFIFFGKNKTKLIQFGTHEVRRICKSGAYWEAWGNCNGKGYQLRAWFNIETRELTDIAVLDDKKNFYFHAETHDLLTK